MTPLTPTPLLEWIRNSAVKSQGTGILRLRVEKSNEEDNWVGAVSHVHFPGRGGVVSQKIRKIRDFGTVWEMPTVHS